LTLDTAVILAGGAATRLRPISNTVPKALVHIAGKPLLQWMIEWLHSNNVKNIVIGVAHLKEQIVDYFGDGSKFGVNLTYSVHTVEGGTGQGFLFAINKYVERENFFAMNGDQITDLNLSGLSSFHLQHGKLATIVVSNPTCVFGHVMMDGEGNVVGFQEKPRCRFAFCNSGIYAFKRSIVRYLPNNGNVETATFPLLTRIEQVKTFPFTGLFLTINNIKDICDAETVLKTRCSK